MSQRFGRLLRLEKSSEAGMFWTVSHGFDSSAGNDITEFFRFIYNSWSIFTDVL